MIRKSMIASAIAVAAILTAAPASAGALRVDTTLAASADRQATPVIPIWDRDWDRSDRREWHHRRWDDGGRDWYHHRPYPGPFFRPYGWNRWDDYSGLTFRFGGPRWRDDDCRVVRVKFRSHGRWVYSRRLICRD